MPELFEVMSVHHVPAYWSVYSGQDRNIGAPSHKCNSDRFDLLWFLGLPCCCDWLKSLGDGRAGMCTGASQSPFA